MKLTELFDTEIIDKTSSNKFSSRVDDADSKKEDKHFYSPTSGSYGRVHADNKDPHIMKKFNHKLTYLASDGYYIYAKSIVDNKIAQENPFAPRIYSITTVTDAENQARFKITIEKLVESKLLSDKLITTAMNNLFDENDIKVEMSKNANRISGVNQLTLAALLEYTVHRKYKSKSSKLNELLYHIGDLRDTNPDLVLDMHRGNFMFRLGAYIPQLVIIDPLA